MKPSRPDFRSGRFALSALQNLPVRRWLPERQRELTTGLLSNLTLSLRWMVAQGRLQELGDLQPDLWFEYLDLRLARGIIPVTVNKELSYLQNWLRFLKDLGRPICERILLIEPLPEGLKSPKDVPVERLKVLQQAIREDAQSSHGYTRRLGLMDMAWFLLMLHCGLRTSEIRLMKLNDIEWPSRIVWIHGSKGLKDRFVFLSQQAESAIKSYLKVRGPQEALPPHVFIFRHSPLTRTYCYQRLKTYGRRCGVRVRPHQLRHSCATLLLNAGAPVLTVKMLFGHKYVDTTLGYARLYAGTVAADYYGAMEAVERRLALPEVRLASQPTIGQLLALVDSLGNGTLNVAQAEALRVLRRGLMAISRRG